MTDNSSQNGTDTIRDIDRAGIKTQVVQLDAGGATEKLVSPSLPMPTKVCDTSKTIRSSFTRQPSLQEPPQPKRQSR
jgi:hypothetical protein